MATHEHSDAVLAGVAGLNAPVKGFTLWELLVVIALIVFLFVTAIENLLPLRAEAERAALVTTVGKLRGAVGLESVRRVMQDDGGSLADLDGANPMNWLAVAPLNYSGETRDFHSVARGGWGFDPATGVLFYRVRYPEYFEGSYDSPPGIRFRVIAKRRPGGDLDLVTLEQLDTGQWDTDGSELGRWLEALE